MIELPEAAVLARQINDTVSGKKIKQVIAAHSPHKFAWYQGDPEKYQDILQGKIIDSAEGFGGMVEIKAEDTRIVFGDGVSLRYCEDQDKRPSKHQLMIEFADSTVICASVQMYGGLWCFVQGDFENQYYQQAKAKSSPLSDRFDHNYFHSLVSVETVEKLSSKAFLATEQRIPGLGNGVLQDILFNAGLHPKKKVKTFTAEDKENLFNSIKHTLSEMTSQGGRDTEKDLYGCPGGYKTKLSKLTAGKPCPICDTTIVKEAYMGGSVYYCVNCQRL